MKTVLLRAPSLTASGYGVHSRQVARWLFENAEKYDLDITTELLNWGATPWITDIHACDGLIGQILQASTNTKPFYDVSIQLQLPNEWNPFLGKFNVGITAAVETDTCNPEWINCVNRMQQVIVPSEFTKSVFLKTAGEKVPTTPIAVVPESFPSVMEDGKTDSVLDIDFETPFNFLVFGQLTGNNTDNDRKNIPYTIKWLAETFAGRDDVGVVLKTNMGRQTHMDRTVCTNVFNKLLAEVGALSAGPRFYLLHGDMTEAEIAGLVCHPKIKASVSLTHGEGFGLPLLEAAACGLPVIATGWSAHTEFLGLGKYIKVESSLAQIHQTRVDNQIFMPTAKWAMPDEADTKRKLIKFYESSTIPKEWAMDLKNKVQSKYNFAAIAQHYDSVLGPKLL